MFVLGRPFQSSPMFVCQARVEGATTLSIMTLSIMELVTTLSITTLCINIQHNSIVCHYAECHDYLKDMLIVIMLSVVRLTVVMLNVVAPQCSTFKVFYSGRLRHYNNHLTGPETLAKYQHSSLL
jgi:hypothetical protein